MAVYKSLVDVYAEELAELHGAEALVAEALPALVASVADHQLREILIESAKRMRRHADGIARILERLGRGAGHGGSVAMAALLERAKQAVSDAQHLKEYAPADMRIREAALIAEWRKVEHHRIAGYACTGALAEVGDDDEDADVLRGSLREIREEDDDLAALADSIIHVQAPW